MHKNRYQQRGESTTKLITTFIITVAVSLLVFKCFYKPPIRYGPGVLVTETPSQGSVDTNQVFKIDEFNITPIYSFAIRARVLHTKTYDNDNDTETVLSPIDLALGWGRMSDQEVIDQLEITQAYRWYSWKSKKMTTPIPIDEIISSSANMHMIPANQAIKRQLMEVIEGNIIRITGYLVEIDGPNGYTWKSSTTREDAGNGSCEVIWVESIVIEK